MSKTPTTRYIALGFPHTCPDNEGRAKDGKFQAIGTFEVTADGTVTVQSDNVSPRPSRERRRYNVGGKLEIRKVFTGLVHTYVTCSCGQNLQGNAKAVKGTTTEKDCHPECRNARSNKCFCSCGGKNHAINLA